MVLADGTPVAAREQPLVVSRSPVDIMGEHGNHIFVRVVIQMMDLVALVEHICQHLRRRRVDYGGGDDVWHVAVIAVLWYTQFGVGIELSNSGQVNVPTIDQTGQPLVTLMS